MPLMKIHVRKGRSTEQIATLMNSIHMAVVRSFDVPERDRYQILCEHEHSHFCAQDTGLSIDRTDNFLLLEVVSRPRSQKQKTAFYANLCEDLARNCSIAPTDVMISFVENTDADWSFGYGRAQFLTGEL